MSTECVGSRVVKAGTVLTEAEIRRLADEADWL